MRICKKCGIEKELEEFRAKKQGTVCFSCLKEYQVAYALQHREKNKQKRVLPEFNYKRYAYSAKQRKHSFNLTFEEFSTFWQQPCSYCGSEISTIGIDRIDSTIGYQLDNCVACCTICNTMKWILTRDEWFNHLRKIVTYSKL